MHNKRDILNRRLALGLSQAELARLAGNGVSQQAVERIENGSTKNSKHMGPILAALDAQEAGPKVSLVRPSQILPVSALPPERVLAALEVAMHILCKSDIAARAAAEALFAVIQDPPPPPLGADPQSVIRIETQRIIERFSGKAH